MTMLGGTSSPEFQMEFSEPYLEMPENGMGCQNRDGALPQSYGPSLLKY